MDTSQGLLGPPAAGSSRKDPPLEPSEGVGPYQHLGFRLLASRTMGEHLSVLHHPVRVWQPQDTCTGAIGRAWRSRTPTTTDKNLTRLMSLWHCLKTHLIKSLESSATHLTSGELINLTLSENSFINHCVPTSRKDRAKYGA